VFDSAGKYSGTIGALGNGPGEWRPGPLKWRVGKDDTLYVLHGWYLSVFGPDHVFTRRIPLPSIRTSNVIPLPGGRFFATIDLRTSKEIGFPFHILLSDGALVRSFGPEMRILPPHPDGPSVSRAILNAGPPKIGPNSLVVVTDDGRHVFGIKGYGFEQWSVTGGFVREVVVDAPWSRRPEKIEIDSAIRDGRWRFAYITPIPRATFAGVDLVGRLWFGELKPVPGTRGSVDSAAEYRYAMTILDPVSTRILVRTDVTEYVELIGGTDIALSLRMDAEELPIFTVWRVSVTGLPQ
jgi:hypothetical protein